MSVIYLDNNATTPIHPDVATVMEHHLRATFGNPSSAHSIGTEAKIALEAARKQVAGLIGARTDELIFTSGGTESNNLALKGAVQANRHRGNRIITSNIEHPAVSSVCDWLELQGYTITVLRVDGSGRLEPMEVERACSEDTVLVSVMLANNELGTIQPIREIADIAHAHGALMHTDAAQAIGKIDVQVDALNVDLLSIAGHKFYAPKGIGALFVRTGTDLVNVTHGADHEFGLRPGTENVLLTSGLGKASELAARNMVENRRHLTGLRDRLENGLASALGGDRIRVNASGVDRLPNTASISFRNVDAATLLAEIGDRVAASAGAACHADQVDVSKVLQAIDLPLEWAMGTVRFSVGLLSTEAEVDDAIKIVAAAVMRLQKNGSQTLTDEVLAGRGDNATALTRYSKGLGCGCKIDAASLERILGEFKPSGDERILADMITSDDAAVFKLSDDTAIVQTADFLTPIVDDPYEFGQIAAANSLSDIYAMGARPLFALNIVNFPTSRLPLSVLTQMIRGAAEKCREAGIDVLGGHSIEDSEPKFGLAVTGIVHPAQVWRNSGAQTGDILVLTKAIGTGLVATGAMRGLVTADSLREATNSMSLLNASSAAVLAEFGVHACTDVTGFGLLGHLHEMVSNSRVDAELWFSETPILRQALELAEANVVPGSTQTNLAHISEHVTFGSGLSSSQRMLLADAQTSGGLLAAVAEADATQILERLRDHGVDGAAAVGRIVGPGSGRITVTTQKSGG